MAGGSLQLNEYLAELVRHVVMAACGFKNEHQKNNHVQFRSMTTMIEKRAGALQGSSGAKSE